MEFDFDEGNDLKKFSDSVDALQFRPGQDTRVDLAVLLAAKVMGAHSELETPKIVVILTDGRQTGGGADVLPAAIAPLMALNAEIVVIGMGEEVDPKELMLLVHDESELVLSDFEQLTHQIEELAVRICVNYAQIDDSEKMQATGIFSDCPAKGIGDCKDPENAGRCDWCRARNVCADKGQCGSRRTPALPDVKTLPVCQCTQGGVKWSDVSNTHFRWLESYPCKGSVGQAHLKQWAECTEVSCPASSPFDDHVYTPVAGGDSQCYGSGRKQCRKNGCSWCSALKACAPKKKCSTLRSRGAKSKQILGSGTKQNNNNVDFKTLLSTTMLAKLGAEQDPTTGVKCLSQENMCLAVGQEYCCEWQQHLVMFYRALNEEMGVSKDSATGANCLSADAPCTQGPAYSPYCCKWQMTFTNKYSSP